MLRKPWQERKSKPSDLSFYGTSFRGLEKIKSRLVAKAAQDTPAAKLLRSKCGGVRARTRVVEWPNLQHILECVGGLVLGWTVLGIELI